MILQRAIPSGSNDFQSQSSPFGWIELVSWVSLTR